MNPTKSWGLLRHRARPSLPVTPGHPPGSPCPRCPPSKPACCGTGSPAGPCCCTFSICVLMLSIARFTTRSGSPTLPLSSVGAYGCRGVRFANACAVVVVVVVGMIDRSTHLAGAAAAGPTHIEQRPRRKPEIRAPKGNIRELLTRPPLGERGGSSAGLGEMAQQVSQRTNTVAS